MKNLKQSKIGEIVASNFRTSKIFTSYSIDFCCGGGITLQEACSKKKIPLNLVIDKIEKSFKLPAPYNYEHLDLNELIDIIINNHHKYIENTIPILQTYLDKLNVVHGEKHKELSHIRQLFLNAANALIAHMKKEEQVLFPFIRAIIEIKNKDQPMSKLHFGIDNPIRMMQEEHEIEGQRFKKISKLCNNYKCPPDGCQTFRVTYATLEEFEQDLHKHIHLENNILFPKAKALFDELDNQIGIN